MLTSTADCGQKTVRVDVRLTRQLPSVADRNQTDAARDVGLLGIEPQWLFAARTA
jgi:hypothetical protein